MVQFRMKALNQMQKPDDLDLLMKVTKPRGWVGVGVVGAALAALVLWGFTGNIPSKVSGEGVVTPAIGISDIQSMVSGFVTDVHIAAGDTVAVGDPVATVETDSGTVTITAPFQGVIGLVFFNAGRVIGVGSDLYLLERTDVGDGELIVYVFVPAEDVSSIAPGMLVDITPENVPAHAFGVLKGEVSKVSAVRVNRAANIALLGDTEFADVIASKFGEAAIIAVSLITDPSTTSGYKWSTTEGPPFKIPMGVRVSAVISQGDVHPIKLVFG